jgi:type II secretory ATPase GspE/PulE/Tfp pilus assembly ATPase PilB-like protein
MVGEIRDTETAKIAINAALTGHLVFSTLHTNNAAGAIPRIIDLGVNPKVISSALTLTIAQRLVRKLCTSCKKEDEFNEAEKKLLNDVIASINKNVKIEIPQIGKAWRAVGCPKCNNTGYKGRSGIYEAILMSGKVEEIVTQNPNERDIVEASKEQGILNMREDGVIKVLRGMTTLDELARVVEVEINK